MSQVPNKDDDIRQWCFDRFKEKDELLDYYKKHQKFPGASEEFEKPGNFIIILILVLNKR